MNGAYSAMQVRRSMFATGSALVALLAGTQAYAQAADTTAPTSVTTGEQQASADIVVTGSRIQRSGFTAPTPTTIIGSGAIEKRGATNIGTVLNETPQFKATVNPATTAPRTIFPGAYYADLRGLGVSRTLVLVDRNRFVPQITTGLANYAIDLNQVPTLLLDRVDIVTGGASAQWGSDAVAGVVNLILKKKYEGFEATGQYGLAEAGDYQEWRIGLLYGTKLGDRTNLEIAGDYIRNRGMHDVYTRDWGRRGFGYYGSPCVSAATAAPTANCRPTDVGPANLRLEDVRYSTMTNGGLIYNTTGPAAQLRGIFFNPDGTFGRFQYGNNVSTGFMTGGGSNQGVNLNTGVDVIPPVRRAIGYARLNHEVGNDFDIYAEASYSDSLAHNQTLPARNDAANGTPININVAQNPFIPASLRAEINRLNALPANAANQITTFSLGRNSIDLGYQYSTVKNRTFRGVGGFNGKIGNWAIDGAVIYGKNRYLQQVDHGRVLARFNFAVDAVAGPNGTPVCRATLPGASFNAAAAGCVPINLFGQGAPSQQAIDYVTATQNTKTTYEQTAANLSITGDLFEMWAGPVSLATGLEYRREKQVTTVDPLTAATAFEASNAPPLAGSFNVKEVFAEVAIPLAKDVTLLRSLEITGAARYTDYSTSGSVTTWKVGGTWSPFEGMLVRANRSRDIRAANLFELYTPAVSTTLPRVFNASVKGGPVGSVATQNLSGGNPNLKPEKSKTTTIGFSYAPTFASGLQFSVDYYDIKVTGTIAAPDPAAIINNCTGTGSAAQALSQAQRDVFCALITPVPQPSFRFYDVVNTFQNINATQRRGWDFEASYRLPLSRVTTSVPGALTLRFSGNYIKRYRETVLGAVTERTGEVSAAGTPKWLTNSFINYDNDLFSIGLQMRTVGKGKYNNTFTEGVNINDNTIEGRTYFNLSGSLRPYKGVEIFGVINNLTDRDPVLAPQSFGFPFVPVWHDPIGRAYRIGVRYKL